MVAREPLPEQLGEMPVHIHDLYAWATENLNEHEAATLVRTLSQNADVFACHDGDLGRFSAVEHQMNTGGGCYPYSTASMPVGFGGEKKIYSKLRLAHRSLRAKICNHLFEKRSSRKVQIRRGTRPDAGGGCGCLRGTDLSSRTPGAKETWAKSSSPLFAGVVDSFLRSSVELTGTAN